MENNKSLVARCLAIFFLLTGAINVIFVFFVHFGVLDAELWQYVYVEVIIDAFFRLLVIIGLWWQKRWCYYAAVTYVVFLSLYMLIELLWVPIDSSTLLYLASYMILNAGLLFVLNRFMGDEAGSFKSFSRVLQGVILGLGGFFLVGYLVNAVVAAVVVIVMVIMGRRIGLKMAG